MEIKMDELLGKPGTLQGSLRPRRSRLRIAWLTLLSLLPGARHRAAQRLMMSAIPLLVKQNEMHMKFIKGLRADLEAVEKTNQQLRLAMNDAAGAAARIEHHLELMRVPIEGKTGSYELKRVPKHLRRARR